MITASASSVMRSKRAGKVATATEIGVAEDGEVAEVRRRRCHRCAEGSGG